MKKLVCLVVGLYMLFTCYECFALELSAASAVIIDGDCGAIIYGKDENNRRTMASTTKIMTAICALEEGNLERKVKIAPEAVGVEGSSIYLRNGEELTLRELTYGLMLNSGNDAAVAIAIAVSGSVENFAKLMNKKALEIGVENTGFKNPNGLDEEGHYTTASDLARITAYAMKNEEFRKIVSTYQTTIPSGEDNAVRYLTNHNKLLKRMEGCIGVKTGFTKKSGRCLVSAAERNGVVLVAVTLNAPDDWNDHIKMMDYGFERVEKKQMCSKGEFLQDIAVQGGVKKKAKVVCKRDFSVSMVSDRCYTSLYKFAGSIKAPLEKGKRVGDVELFMGDTLIGTVPAVIDEAVEEDKTRHFDMSFEKILKEYF